ncbi:MAG: hypothetical protein IJO33_00130 [Bacilli bacterium]|nr:hypothetical protein [Bacilli bacterium]
MNNNQINDVKTEAFITLFSSIGTIIGGLVFSGFCFLVFIKGADTFTRVVIIPFLICGIAVLIKGLSLLFQGINMMKAVKDVEDGNFSNAVEIEKTHKKLIKADNFTNKLYIFGFLIFWFGFLIVFDYSAIKDWSNGGSSMFFFSFIFWIAGIFILVKNFKKK